MLIEEIMHKDVAYLTAENTIEQAMNVMHERKIRHVPIVNDKHELIAIVSDRDIRDASPSIFHADEHLEDLQKPLSSIMKTNVVTTGPLDFVEDAASTLYEHDISSLPVTEDDVLVGMITETDILHTLVKLTGAHQPSSQIEIRVPNISGQLADVAALFKANNKNVTSVLVYPCEDPEYKILVFRVQTMDPRRIIETLESSGYEVMWPRMPGMSP
ncbi:acetoin utilization protein AcuB [Salsuginibacillus halophilus]|uniref:Acetoin utilization protein AcuB n=1 Tax=Salsuginibacillus halophilus TaxID=517424 RepID=A0A2P8HEC1_9BACI|nr:acetoin utilization AcuB family protein [Salsuginibacillus halophilus]PSL44554.1 acetoin utilization protein AcuB [Salsuginibacillus halophilus]